MAVYLNILKVTRLLHRNTRKPELVRNCYVLLSSRNNRWNERKGISVSQQCCRCVKTAAAPSEDNISTKQAPSQEFTNVYTFRYIVHCKVLSRLKIYQTLLTVGALPPGMYLNATGHLATSSLLSFVGIASLATVMLYIMSTFFRRIVGIISVNRTFDIVRISHLTFWGRRNNVDFWTQDIVPLSDTSVNPKDAYQVIKFYDRPERFYWFQRHGKNTNADVLEHIFGKI